MAKKRSKKALEREFLKSWREGILERDNHSCQVCGKVDGKLDVHHIIPRSNVDTRYDRRNGITLCFRHHKVGKLSAHMNSVWFADFLKEWNYNTYCYILAINKTLKEKENAK